MRWANRLCSPNYWDVIVVGGGHAGCEAAAASARMGCKTMLITNKFDTIGEMSCNPSFGGIGKGHLIREIDAMDGLCGRICDLSGVNFQVLNRRHGPAVWGLRAQIDRKLYKDHMQSELTKTRNLSIKESTVRDIQLNANGQRVEGILIDEGKALQCAAVILATGTFLRGEIFLGLNTWPAGRMGESATYELSNTLQRLGARLGRLRTGTPPRLLASTVNTRELKAFPGEPCPVPFSFMNKRVAVEPKCQIPCYMTMTNERVEQLVRANLHANRHVHEEVNAPRYCPSLESKIIRFNRPGHQVWIEPEGFSSDLLYPNGITMTFAEDVQQEIVNCIEGLEEAKIVRPGYGVQYDYVDPRQVKLSLETKFLDGLFLCGQINGTTGYEEAAAQGVLAGVNAASKVIGKQPFVMQRTSSYIGVMIDDLTSVGTTEPYRMLTSRAEFRLYLRPDNADIRLTQKAYDQGCVSEDRYGAYKAVERDIKEVSNALKKISYSRKRWKQLLPDCNFGSKPHGRYTAFELLSVYNIPMAELIRLFPHHLRPSTDVESRIRLDSFYEGFMKKDRENFAQLEQDINLQLDDIDYEKLNLSADCMSKLQLHRPQTIAAAQRIPGITPAALVQLMYHTNKRKAQQQNSEQH